MYILIFLLLVPFLLIVFFGLFALIFAWSTVVKFWYSLTGKKTKWEQGASGRYGYSGDYSNRQETNHQSTDHSSRQSDGYHDAHSTHQSGGQKQKIFSKNDGEYVDFEIVE